MIIQGSKESNINYFKIVSQGYNQVDQGSDGLLSVGSNVTVSQ